MSDFTCSSVIPALGRKGYGGSFAEIGQPLIFAATKRRLLGSNLPFNVVTNMGIC
jgi:hypothetical protein